MRDEHKRIKCYHELSILNKSLKSVLYVGNTYTVAGLIFLILTTLDIEITTHGMGVTAWGIDLTRQAIGLTSQDSDSPIRCIGLTFRGIDVTTNSID